MYIGSTGPCRLLHITPTQPPSNQPTLDLLTQYLVQVLETARVGLFVDKGDGFYDFEVGATATEQTCACGVTAPGTEYYIQELGLFGNILPPLALHFLIWHRAEVPERHLESIRQAATGNLTVRIGARHLEPPKLVEERTSVQHGQVISIVYQTLEGVRVRAKPTALTDALAQAIQDSGTRQVGWGHTYAKRDAVVAIYAQTHPDGSTNYATDYLYEKVQEWASHPTRTLAEVELVLEQALKSLIGS